MRRIRDVEHFHPELQIHCRVERKRAEEAHVEVGVAGSTECIEPRGAEPRVANRQERRRIEIGLVHADAAQYFNVLLDLIGALRTFAFSDRAAEILNGDPAKAVIMSSPASRTYAPTRASLANFRPGPNGARTSSDVHLVLLVPPWVPLLRAQYS